MGPGDHIGQYRIERLLGTGAFATVWLATDTYLDDQVAIKILADNWSRDDDIRRRFIEEARIMRRIDHARIVRVFSVDELPGGQPVFVMSYADRGTLAERIADRRAQARRFDTDEVATVMSELVACLTIVHDFGVVHRDLKPSNVLFRTPRRHDPDPSPAGETMVLGDFGLAKDTIARSGFTLAAGTPAYMAPEQARTTSELDHRADLYAATAIMFELLTGTPPFRAATLSDVSRTRGRRDAALAESRADLAPRWQELIDIGLADQPAHRFQSAGELGDAVRAAAGVTGGAHAGAGVARTPAPPLGGLLGRVDDILGRFGPGRSAAIDRRLRDAAVVAIVGDDTPGASSAADERGLVAVRLAAGDARLADADVVVVPGTLRDAVLNDLRGAPAGPVAIVDASDRASIDHVLDLVARRTEAIRASAALSQLDDDVRHAGSVAMSEAWMRVRELVEQVRLDVPALAELDTVRAVVARRALLTAQHAATLHRVLLEADAAARLGVDPDTPDATLLDLTVAQLADWRSLQDAGRVPFGSRDAVETVVRCLERQWAALSGHTG